MPLPPKSANYAAVLVSLRTLLPLAGCDNVQAAIIFNNQVIVSKTAYVGELGLYFPPEVALSHEFLSKNNLYRKAEYGNVDPDKTGFFEEAGRVKTMKFRGHKSEGLWLPISCLDYIGEDITVTDTNALATEGTTFDALGPYEICKKYVPKGNPVPKQRDPKQHVKRVPLKDLIVEGQFNFHIDTSNLRRNIHKINPDDTISITDKWHGTSVVIGKLLVKRNLSRLERVARYLGVRVQESAYGLTYSSRTVVKAVNTTHNAVSPSFYTDDIWGVVAREVEHLIPDGFTLYGEIVGFTPSGSAIQSKYAYGCKPGEHKFMLYRVTSTNHNGLSVELSWPQLKEFATKRGLHTMPELYYGKAKDFIPFGPGIDQWQSRLLDTMERAYVYDQDCPYNAKGVPAEGIVLRVEGLHGVDAYKLKNFKFLAGESKELDKGVLDIETAQSEVEEEAGMVLA